MRRAVILAVAVLLASALPATAQMQCYYLNGKQVCCFKIGDNTVCQ